MEPDFAERKFCRNCSSQEQVNNKDNRHPEQANDNKDNPVSGKIQCLKSGKDIEKFPEPCFVRSENNRNMSFPAEQIAKLIGYAQVSKTRKTGFSTCNAIRLEAGHPKHRPVSDADNGCS